MRSKVYAMVESPSVCLIVRQQERRAAGLLLNAPRAGDIGRWQAPALSSNGAEAGRMAATAGSVVLKPS